MGRTTKLQTSFQAGVLDPRLAARKDIKPFYEGMSIGSNVLCLPQGGIRRRPGMGFAVDVTEDCRIASFAFNVEQTYLIVFIQDYIQIYKDDVLQATVQAPYQPADFAEIRFVQSADTMIIVHELYQPRKLTRGASHTAWNITKAVFSNIPQLDFKDSLSPTPTNESQHVVVPGGWAGGETFTLTLEGNVTSPITYTGVFATTAANIQAALRALPNTSATGINVVHHTGADYDARFQGDDNGKDWELMTATVITGGGSVVVSIDVEGTGSDEDVWSDTRGWPKTVAWFEGRLCFGGTTHLPQSLWLSKTNDYFNFDLGTALADEAIFITLDTDQVNAINGLFSSRHLQIFTSGGEFFIPTRPITPTDVSVLRQSVHGSLGIHPTSIDGATMFLDGDGKTLRDFTFTYEEEAYNASSVSMLAPHLISQPIEMAAVRGLSGDEANYIFIVNDDGTMAVLNTLKSEGVLAWTTWETSGTILGVVTVVDEVYFYVQRTINSVTRYFIEKIDWSSFTDCNANQTQASSTTVTGLDHLDGEACRVKADGAVMEDATPSGGSITLARAGVNVEVGLNFDPEAKTMPLNMDFADGPTLTRDKRVVKVQAHLYESLGVYIEDVLIPSRKFGEGILDTTPDPYTGLDEVYLLGWSELADVTITQRDPLPMTILALAVEVEG